MWGVLPAYGLYARHARGLTLNNVRFELAAEDMRPAVVCDDVENLEIAGLKAAGDKKAESLLRLRATRGRIHPPLLAAESSGDLSASRRPQHCRHRFV